MNWKEKLQVLDKSATEEERAIRESEIVLDFMQTEVFTRLVKLRDELIEMGLTVTLIPNCADDIKLPDDSFEMSVLNSLSNYSYAIKVTIENTKSAAEHILIKIDWEGKIGRDNSVHFIIRNVDKIEECPTTTLSKTLSEFKDNFSDI
ncbi:hypothetical protein B9G53_08515 [Pseudanabaena sp. SR411]|uniref:hypothetical protein n=1 Tax=Pseudanabaena sp. SR411 TaxID=1980935 RepID=UPI000B983C40|nr:hypothetical protein [Pseudanabaena sp. SR411]OYQ65127.1 hypothetical protein B9G53_08515 [Pseudanabaena sp. SR411]